MKKVMRVIDEEKNSGEYEVFCTFDSGLTNKSYVLYTEYGEDKDGNILMHAGSYVKNEEDVLIVDKRLTEQENEMISTLMESIIEQAKKENN